MNSNNSSSSGSTCSNTSFVGALNNTATTAGSQMKLNEQTNFDAPSYAPSSNQPPQDVTINNTQQNQEIDTFMNNFMDTELNKPNVESQAESSQTDTKMVGNLGDSYPTQDINDMQNPNSLTTNNNFSDGIMPNASEVTTSSYYSGDNNNQQLLSVNYSGDNHNQQLPINSSDNNHQMPQTFMTEKQMNDINNMADSMAAAEASEVQQQQQQTQQKSKLAQLMQQPYMSSSSSSQLDVQQKRSLIQQPASGGVEQQSSGVGAIEQERQSQPLPYPSSQPNQQLGHSYTTNAANNVPIQQSMGEESDRKPAALPRNKTIDIYLSIMSSSKASSSSAAGVSTPTKNTSQTKHPSSFSTLIILVTQLC